MHLLTSFMFDASAVEAAVIHAPNTSMRGPAGILHGIKNGLKNAL